MKTIMKYGYYAFAVLAVSLLVAACSGTPQITETPPEAVCSTIINAKCVRCHYKTRICDALGTKSVRQWVRSIDFMIKQGAELSGEEKNKVIACLSSMPQGSDIVCK